MKFNNQQTNPKLPIDKIPKEVLLSLSKKMCIKYNPLLKRLKDA